MYKYAIWVRTSPLTTANTVLWADNDFDAKALAEAQYGRGNVLNYSRIYE
jgi:hypothetical protein